MKAIILVVLLAIGISLSFTTDARPRADTPVESQGGSDYYREGRVIHTTLDEGVDLFTDTRTGCQFIQTNRGNYGRPAMMLGCFEEYKKPESK